MGVLPRSVIRNFVKEVGAANETEKKTTYLGTVAEYTNHDGMTMTGVILDGAIENTITPVVSAAGVNPGDRVSVSIDNHRAYILGNFQNPSAPMSEVIDNYNDSSANIQKLYELIKECATSGNLKDTENILRGIISETYDSLVSMMDNKYRVANLAKIQALMNYAHVDTIAGNTALVLEYNPYRIFITETGILLMHYNTIIADFTNNQAVMHDVRIDVGSKFIHGNFAEVPRSDGSSMLVKVG